MFPHWIPTSETDLRRACEEGSLHESHHWDAKKQVEKTDRARLGIAKDIAAMSVDGGVIVIGLDEEKEDKFVLSPVPLVNFPTRIAEIAEAHIQPAVMTVRCSVLHSEQDADVGYVFIIVEPSADAPHQVDGTYYRRGDKKNETMSDAEVSRLLARRRTYGTTLSALLDREVAREPVRSTFMPGVIAPIPFGHIYWVAEPVASRPHQAVPLHNGGEMQRFLADVVADREVPGFVDVDYRMPPQGYLPTLAERRADGWALATRLTHKNGRRYEMKTGNQHEEVDKRLGDIDFLRNGGVRAVFGSALFAPDTRYEPEALSVDIGYLLRLTHRLLRITAHYGAAIKYQHGWDIGIHITSLRGKSADDGHGNFWQGGTPWSEDHYREAVTATARQVTVEPWLVVSGLMARLAYGLDTYDTAQRLLTAPPASDD